MSNEAANIAVQAAAMRALEKDMKILAAGIDNVSAQVGGVDNRVSAVSADLQELRKNFEEYVHLSEMHHNEEIAQSRLIEIRQKIEKKFGHYDEVRRITIGILQASDVQLVRKETVTTASEEIMLKTPGYWLAPCLVALSAWINDNRELAEKAIQEAMRRDAEKTALLFTLICRRAGRKQASLQWASVYLAAQSVSSLDRHVIVVIDAFTNGLLGRDTEGLVAGKINEWLEELKLKPGYEAQQITQWSTALKG